MTPRQKDCLDAIKEMTVDGVPPTYEQLRVRLGLAAKSGVHRLVHALHKRGYITLAPYRDQSIAVMDRSVEDIPLDKMADAVWAVFQVKGRPSWADIHQALHATATRRT